MSQSEPKIGMVVEGFRLDSVLGKGGMGTVYKATQLRLKRPVALKVLPPGYAMRGRKRLERFLREAQVAAQLSHPNIVQVFDAGEHEHLFYIAMELVEGRTLREIVVQKGPLQEASAVAIFLQCGHALEAALEKNLIHRDIKPDNIMITQRGLAKVADFGLARDLASADRITAPGAVLGTPAFMSPEQGRGDEVDHRSDLYSLGATLFFALTGRFPYQAKSPADVIRMHLKDPIPDPLALRPPLSNEWRDIVARLMAKKPEERIQNVREMIEILERLAGPAQIGLATVSDGGDREAPRAGKTAPPADEHASLDEPIRPPTPPRAETLEVPTDAFRARQVDAGRFQVHTVEGFGEEEHHAGPTLAEVESERFQRLPGSGGGTGLDAGLLAVRKSDPPLKIFVLSRETARLGRQASVEDPREGRVKMDWLLRALPCRSRDRDPENYEKNLLISRYHATLSIGEGEVVLTNRKNRGIAVEGKPLPAGRSLRLPEHALVSLSQGALLLDIRVYPAAEAGTLFSVQGDAPGPPAGMLGMEGPSRIAAVRILRPSNAKNHAYVLLVREAGIGEDEDAAIRIPGTGRGARLYRYRKEFLLGAPAGGVEVRIDGRALPARGLASLAPGAVVKVGSREMEFRAPQEEDFKTL